MKIWLRLFSSTTEGRRGSLVTREVTLQESSIPRRLQVRDLCEQYPEYDLTNVRIARVTHFLQEQDVLEHNETLNVLPL